MKHPILQVTALTLTALMSACSTGDNPINASPAPKNATPGVGYTAFDSVVLSEEHSIWEELIMAAGLANQLDNPESAFTIFAPTNAAFTRLDNDDNEQTLTTNELRDSDNQQQLRRFVLNHIIIGSHTTTDVSQALSDSGGTPWLVANLLTDHFESGTSIDHGLLIRSSDGPFGLAVENSHLVTTAQKEAHLETINLAPENAGEQNGMVHGINGVLYPDTFEEEDLPNAGTDPLPVETPEPAEGVTVSRSDFGDYYSFENAANETVFKAESTHAGEEKLFGPTAFIPMDAYSVTITSSETLDDFYIVSDGAKRFTISGFKTLEFESIQSDSSSDAISSTTAGIAELNDDGIWTMYFRITH